MELKMFLASLKEETKDNLKALKNCSLILNMYSVGFESGFRHKYITTMRNSWLLFFFFYTTPSQQNLNYVNKHKT